MKLNLLLSTVLLSFLHISAVAEDSNSSKVESPWLAVPLVSSGPKMGTSLGAMLGYLYKFDEESPTSTFAMAGTYSNSDSYFVGIFGRTFFDKNMQRLSAGLIYGNIKNEYKDFLGGGFPLNSTDDFQATFLRYSYKFFPNVYIGGQFVSSNYEITGNDPLSDFILDELGLSGFSSNGLGLTAEYDTRDNINSPQKGSFVNINTLSYRKNLGGNENFDVINLQSRYYYQQMKKLILAMRLDGKFTIDAPSSAYATVNLRGYTSGQYLAQNSTTFEAEERLDLTHGIGAVVFSGVSALYGNNSSEFYPSLGGGLNYMMKKEEKMVVRLEGAVGEYDSYGIYLQFGRAF